MVVDIKTVKPSMPMKWWTLKNAMKALQTHAMIEPLIVSRIDNIWVISKENIYHNDYYHAAIALGWPTILITERGK